MTQNHVTADADAIQVIQETAVKASRAAVLPIEGEVSHVVRIAHPDGSVTRHVLDPNPRLHEFSTLGALIAFTRNAIEGRHGEANPVVWLGEHSVSVVVNDETRRDVGILSLQVTPQFEALQTRATATWRSQTDMIRLLRLDLADTLPGDSTDLLARMRNVRFKSAADGHGNVQHGKESMGRSINAEVLGVDTLPDDVTLAVRVYAVPDLRTTQNIRCALDIAVEEQQFRLVPRPMACADALAAVGDEIGKILADELECPIYRGTM